MEPEDRESLTNRLESMAEPLQPVRVPPPAPTEHDPAKAADYFAAMGIAVKRKTVQDAAPHDDPASS